MALAATPQRSARWSTSATRERCRFATWRNWFARSWARKSQVELIDYQTAYGKGFEDMRRRVPDVSLLRSLVGSAPFTPLEETIREIADYTASAR